MSEGTHSARAAHNAVTVLMWRRQGPISHMSLIAYLLWNFEIDPVGDEGIA
jgi:hypothetical protein